MKSGRVEITVLIHSQLVLRICMVDAYHRVPLLGGTLDIPLQEQQ